MKDDPSKGDDSKPRKRRGRPPRVDTPMESRIAAILKGLRKIKGSNGEPMLRQFVHLPDKAEHPDYYQQIKELMAVEVIKVCARRDRLQPTDFRASRPMT